MEYLEDNLDDWLGEELEVRWQSSLMKQRIFCVQVSGLSTAFSHGSSQANMRKTIIMNSTPDMIMCLVAFKWLQVKR